MIAFPLCWGYTKAINECLLKWLRNSGGEGMPEVYNSVEVFCSYAHVDERWQKKLETHLSLLKRQGLISTWSARQMLIKTAWAQDVEAHLSRASVILLLISPDFLASDFCSSVQMQHVMTRHRTGEARVIPILVRPVDNWQAAPFALLQALPLNTKPLSLWSDVDLAFVEVAAGIRHTIEDLSKLALSSPQSNFPPIWNVPLAPNPFFTGREELLTRLHSHLHTGQRAALSQPQAISGLGGIGKTQLAVEYAYRFRQDYQAVLWAHAENVETLTSSYLTLAMLLKLPEQAEREQAVIIGAIKTWLQTHQRWLLILDNADDPDLLAPFLPPVAGGHLLLTTRARALRRFGIATPLELETFDVEQGAVFLLRRAGLLAPDAFLEQASPSEQQRARQLSEEMGGLPLALDQAAAYLEATGTNLETYQRLYEQHTMDLLKDRRGRPQDHPEPVTTTWSLSFERVEKLHPAAADLLRLCSYLAPNAIGEEMLTAGAKELGPVLAPVAVEAYLLEQVIEALRAYSLMERDPVTKTLTVHRLVQAVVRESLSTRKRKRWMQRSVQMMNSAFPPVDITTWPQCERCLPHALRCADWIEQGQFTTPEAANLLHLAGYYLAERIRCTEAEPLLQRALSLNERVLGVEHPDTATNLNNLGDLYWMQGKHTEAELLYQRALSLRERVLGVEHPDLARSLNSLAVLYREQGKYTEVEPLYQRALTIQERVLGTEHPDTSSTLNNLAVLYRAQGKYAQAEILYQRALAIRERVLGDEHPNLAESLNNLAVLYRVQGKYAQAETLYQRALAIQERVLGAEHPNTAQSLNNLGYLYRVQGKYMQAESLSQRALTIREQVLGNEHPDTVRSLNNLATLYREQGKSTEAETLYQRALAIRERILGNDHPDIAQSLNDLATLYREQGKSTEAEALYQRALAIRERVLGNDHPNTAQSLNDLATLYREQGKQREAEALYQHALAIREQVLGAEHPDLAQSLNDLGYLYHGLGEYSAAKLFYQRALAIYERVLGAEHPYIQRVQANYTDLLKRMEADEEHPTRA
jgi:tetratricopeptide (TPR) repeat protein